MQCCEGPKALGDAQGLTMVWLVVPWVGAGILRGPFGGLVTSCREADGTGQDEATHHILKRSQEQGQAAVPLEPCGQAQHLCQRGTG